MTQYKKRAVLIALSLTLITVFIVLLTLLTPEIPVCPETTGTIERTEFYEDQNGNWIREDLSWNIGKDISAIRITDLNDLNRIAAVNYVPDRFVVPGTLPQDAAIVSLDQTFDFASCGTLILCVLSPDPFANDFTAQAEALDRYKIGDYWTFSFLIPNVFNASNIYYDNQLVACNGEIENYEFIRFNTSDDRVTVEHRAQTEPIRITLKFYTRREALSDHYITIHYQSNGTLSGIGDMPLIGTESRILSVQKQAPRCLFGRVDFVRHDPRRIAGLVRVETKFPLPTRNRYRCGDFFAVFVGILSGFVDVHPPVAYRIAGGDTLDRVGSRGIIGRPPI